MPRRERLLLAQRRMISTFVHALLLISIPYVSSSLQRHCSRYMQHRSRKKGWRSCPPPPSPAPAASKASSRNGPSWASRSPRSAPSSSPASSSPTSSGSACCASARSCSPPSPLTREYGFAIPAGITGGVGTMVYLVTSGSIDPSSVTSRRLPLDRRRVRRHLAARSRRAAAHDPSLAARPGNGPRSDRSGLRGPPADGPRLDPGRVALVLVVAGAAMVLRRHDR